MTPIEQGLLITGIGMGLVFVVIIFLWGLMALMMRLTSGKEKQTTDEALLPAQTDEPLVPELENAEGQRRAAAAAVAVSMALALAGRKQLPAVAQSDPGNLSPWQAVHRARQMEEK
jgi:Na+-transporting methylmalonyl-CoA/oxaloacetate decarboxylase gamma subunit